MFFWFNKVARFHIYIGTINIDQCAGAVWPAAFNFFSSSMQSTMFAMIDGKNNVAPAIKSIITPAMGTATNIHINLLSMSSLANGGGVVVSRL